MLGGVTGKGFMPGQSGNPRGGPRGPRTLTTRLRKIIDQETKDGKDYGDLVMQVLVKAALKGDMKAMSLLLDRVDGKVAQEIQVHETAKSTNEALSILRERQQRKRLTGGPA